MIREKRLLRAATVVAILTVLPSAAGASHFPFHPTFRTENDFFHCEGQTRVSNIDFAYDGTTASWNPSAPTESLRQGAGCVAYNFGGETNRELYAPVFTGTFRGNIRDLTVRAYEVLSPTSLQNTTQDIKVWVELDGRPLIPKALPGLADDVVNVRPVPTNDGLTALYEFSVTNIGKVTEYHDAEGNVVNVTGEGAATEDGNGTATHELTIAFGFSSPTRHGVWAWDATETPSGIVFNPPTLATPQLAMKFPQ